MAVADRLGTPNRIDLFKTKNLGLQLVRSTLMLATTALNFLGLKYLRLDQTVTIIFLAPLLVALLPARCSANGLVGAGCWRSPLASAAS